MKKILNIALLIAAVIFAGCENYFDEKYLDNGNKPYTLVTTKDYVLTNDDYSTLASLEKNKAIAANLDHESFDADSMYINALDSIGKKRYFDNLIAPDVFLPAFIYNKYPHFDIGSLFRATYNIWDSNLEDVVEEQMTFELTAEGWEPNISTYYTTPFVGDGQADFTIQHVSLDGLSYVWRYQALYGMTASAYVNNIQHPVEDWLISPEISLKHGKQPILNFDHAIRFGNVDYNKDWLKVMITTDFTGDVTTSEWDHLEFTDPIPDGSNWTFLNSGNFDLSPYNGQKITIAFQYNTTTGNLTSAPTWEIQNFIVCEYEEDAEEAEDTEVVEE